MKIKLYTITFLIIFLFSACEREKNQTKPKIAKPTPVVSNKPKIVAFGDSLTAGFGLQEKESYPYLLQEKLKAEGYNYEVINAGVSGDTSAGGMERIDWSLDQEGVEILILELGGNDLLRGLSQPQMKGNITEIIKRTKAKNVKILLCGLFPENMSSGELQKNFASVYVEIAKEQKVPYMPFFLEGVGGKKEFNQPDGIHPNADGSKIITENVYKNLMPLLKK